MDETNDTTPGRLDEADHKHNERRRMTLREQFRAHPMTWRDYVSALGVAVTIGTMLVQGGRLVEAISTTNANVVALRSQVTQLQSDGVRMATELEKQRGTDGLHDEQIRTLRRDIETLSRNRGGR